MNDVADGLLPDVRDISLSDLEFTDVDSALSQALERILMSKPDCNFNSFNNFISLASAKLTKDIGHEHPDILRNLPAAIYPCLDGA